MSIMKKNVCRVRSGSSQVVLENEDVQLLAAIQSMSLSLSFDLTIGMD